MTSRGGSRACRSRRGRSGRRRGPGRGASGTRCRPRSRRCWGSRSSAGSRASPGSGARLKSARLVDYLTNAVLAESSTEVNPRGAGFTVVEMLDRSAARIGGDFQGQPEIEAAVREAVGGAYLSLGEFARAETHLRAAL